MFDARGAEVDNKIWKEHNADSIPEHAVFDYSGDWPAGIYRIVLQSRYGRDSQQCIIIR